jgi:hypothetical protein
MSRQGGQTGQQDENPSRTKEIEQQKQRQKDIETQYQKAEDPGTTEGIEGAKKKKSAS